MPPSIRLGSKVRALRRRINLTQSAMAGRLGISPSYLNLIEHDRRPLSATLLIRLAQNFDIDIQAFAHDDDRRLVADLLEAFGDPVFEGQQVPETDLREMATAAPAAARAVMTLYQAYRGVRESLGTLAGEMEAEDEASFLHPSRLPSEEVTDLLQRHMNHFPELEVGAEHLVATAGLHRADLFQEMAAYLRDVHQVRVEIVETGAMRGAARRFDPRRRVLRLSELLRRGSRNFQLAHQIGLLTQGDVLDRLSADETLTTPASRALARVSLASYFAGAVLMPYTTFLDAARAERYDIELLGHRFRASFEQVCHRLTTLRRPGNEGIPLHLVRVDIAGNISKRFSASGMRFARFSAACPLWNVHAAFLTPGTIRVRLSRMPDGSAYLDVARTLRKDTGGFHAPHPVRAIDIGCEVSHAREMVYAEGMDLANLDAADPIGVTCRLCERLDCEERAFAPLAAPLQVNENLRGLSFYAPVDED